MVIAKGYLAEPVPEEETYLVITDEAIKVFPFAPSLVPHPNYVKELEYKNGEIVPTDQKEIDHFKSLLR